MANVKGILTRSCFAYLTICSASLFSLFASPICSAAPNGSGDFMLTVDKYYSPYMGANWNIAGLRAYQAIDDIVASSSEGDCSACMSAIRAGKWFFEFTLFTFGSVLQHEYFGHGARAREFDIGTSYHINVYSGNTVYNASEYNNLDANQKAALSSGGVEATSILSQQIERGWMWHDYLDNREATMFLVNALDQSVYAFSTSGHFLHPDNDAQSYIANVNAWYGTNALTSHKLKVSVAWDWLDPMLYISAWSLFKYLWMGQPGICFDTLHIGESRFMPTTRTLLAPYGPEFQLQAHLISPDDRYYGVFLRYGHLHGHNSYGADLLVNPMALFDCWYLTNWLSVWHQPHLLQPGNATTNTSKWGFAEFLGAYYNVTSGIYAYGELGYKVSGYVPGVQLSEGVIWRVGFRFDYNLPQKKKKSTKI